MNDDEDEILHNTMDDEQNAKKQRKQEKQESQNTLLGRAKQTAKDQAKDRSREAIKKQHERNKKARKIAKKARQTAGKTAKVANPVGATVFLIILLIIIIIGIISFITSMPGLVQQEIMKKVMGAKSALSYTLGGSDYYLTELATEEGEQYRKDVLKYIYDMGLDPAGFGFAPFFTVTEDGEVQYDTSIRIDEAPEVHELFSALVYNWIEQKKIQNEDLIFKYLVSNERAYLVDDDSKGTKIIEKLGVTPIYESLFGSTKLKGMIKLNLEGGFGNDQWHTFVVDRENQRLVIATANVSETKFKLKVEDDVIGKKLLSTGLINGIGGLFIDKTTKVEVDVPIQTATYDLSTYVGRYGTPLEMLLALHLATMSSDLTDEMITNENLQTEVKLDLKLDTYDTEYTLVYDGTKTLPVSVGYQGFSEPDMHKYIEYEEGSNKAKITQDSENAGITIRSLRNWAERVTEHKGLSPEAEQQKARAVEAKNALLGSDGFYVEFRTLEDIGEKTIMDAIGPRKGTENDAIYLGTTNPERTGVVKLHGLQYYMNGHESEICSNQYTRNGVTGILSQLDACLVLEDLESISNYEFTKDNYLLTQEWLDFISNSSNFTEEKVHAELEKLSKEISNYFDIIEHKEEKVQQVIDSFLGVHLTVEDLQTIINGTKDLPEEYEFAMPRIEYVIKHWYKDVIFEDKNIDGVYKKTSSIQPIPISSVQTQDGHAIEIDAVLTGGKAYSQTGQPYVVKGDVVTLDGDIVENSGVENLKYGDYKVGDGYRTTKKLFTQGQYYVFDGSKETSQSIYFARELEKLKPNSNNEFAIVHVKNGRISVLNTVGVGGKPLEIIGSSYNNGKWDISTQFVGDKRNKADLGSAVIEDPDGNWTVFLAKAYDSGANVYYVKANNELSYHSPAKYSFENSKTSVKKINSLLNAMGVVTTRKPISFDNTTSDGEIATLTAFEILEGMHTEAAEDIYKDLKEMLIELGYFTKAEFDQLSTNVLAWFIPEYKPNTRLWRQNKEEDALSYGAFIYPASEFEKTEDNKENNSEEENNSEQTTNVTKVGFEPDLDVVAPGNARISTITDKEIKLLFDGISQPEIGALDGYTLDIVGINVDRAATVHVIDSEGNESEVSLQEAYNSEGKYIVKMGEVIGKTGTTKIQVILTNRNKGYIENIEDYMAPDISVANSSSTEFSICGTLLTESEFVSCCTNYMSANGIVNNDFSESNLKDFYRICKKYGVNPEYAFTTAVTESSLTYSAAVQSHNYWGWGVPNGGSYTNYNSMLEVLEGYCKTIASYQDPTNSLYNEIMNRYELRKNCTENGGCNPNGYGKPNTMQGVQSVYSWLGSHVEGDTSSGGYYFLDPARCGVPVVYQTHEEFVQKCQKVHAPGSETTVWEQNEYTAYQVEQKIDIAKRIFGDRAGKYMY